MNRINPFGPPIIALGLLLILAPPMTMLVLSFSADRFPAFPLSGWSMVWYREFFTDSSLQMSLLRSAVIGISAAILANLLGFTTGYRFARQQNQRAIYWVHHVIDAAGHHPVYPLCNSPSTIDMTARMFRYDLKRLFCKFLVDKR